MDTNPPKLEKLLVVHPQPGLRTTFTGALRSVGYQKVGSVGTLKDAWGLLESEDFDWLITPLMPTAPINALHLLEACAQHPELKGLHVSLLVTEDEMYAVDHALANGLFSWHPAPNTLEAFLTEMKALRAEADAALGSRILLSSAYARKKLIHDGRIPELVQLTASVMAAQPSSLQAMAHYADALIRAGNLQRARAMVFQLGQKAEKNDPILVQLEAALAALAGTDEGKPLARVKSTFVCEPDEQFRSIALKCAQDLGCDNVRVFADGGECWQTIQGGEVPGILLTEWKMPQVTGLQLLQRLRSAGHHETMLVVTSSLVSKAELPVLKEMTVCALLPKPYTLRDLSSCMTWLGSEMDDPSDARMLGTKVRATIRSGKLDEAKRHIDALIVKSGADNAVVLELCAELSMAHGFADEAKRLSMESLRKQGNSVTALSVLAKALLQLGQTGEALKVMERAHQLSPTNVERVCAIAEANDDLGNGEAAQKALAAAKGLDAGSQTVNGAAMNIALAHGDLESARTAMNSLIPIEVSVRYLNNKAVAMVRGGKLNEAIQLYENALSLIPEKEASVLGSVRLNLALAQMRIHDYQKAAGILKAIGPSATASVREKSARLLESVNAAIAAGRKLSFAEPKVVKAGADPDVGRLLARTTADSDGNDPGLLKILPRAGTEALERIKPLLATKARFVPRRQSVGGVYVAGAGAAVPGAAAEAGNGSEEPQ